MIFYSEYIASVSNACACSEREDYNNDFNPSLYKQKIVQRNNNVDKFVIMEVVLVLGQTSNLS